MYPTGIKNGCVLAIHLGGIREGDRNPMKARMWTLLCQLQGPLSMGLVSSFRKTWGLGANETAWKAVLMLYVKESSMGLGLSGCFNSDIISSHKNMFQKYGQ